MGRFIGLSFIIPGAYFAYKGYMSRVIRHRSALVAALIAGQVCLALANLLNVKTLCIITFLGSARLVHGKERFVG